MTNNTDSHWYAQVGEAERKVLRMVWNTLAITGWIALGCALTQLG